MNRVKDFTEKVLQGLSIGIVVTLIPGALLGELMKALMDVFPLASTILDITNMTTRMLPICIGFCIAMQFKFSPIECASIGIAAIIGSGIATATEKGAFVLVGTGDVINTAITAAIAVMIILAVGNKLKAYKMLVVPMVTVVIGGGLGLMILPYTKQITVLIGEFVNMLTNLQPLLMCVLIAIIFAIIIVSPVSSVGVALAIQLSGVGSGAANLGITAAAIGLGIAGFKINGLGITIVHFLGSPKIQVSNFIKKPSILLPIICNAAVLGGFAQIFQIKGTPLSAGFGITGLIGPLTAWNLSDGSSFSIIGIIVSFFLVPPLAAIIFNKIFRDQLKIVSPEDYKIQS